MSLFAIYQNNAARDNASKVNKLGWTDAAVEIPAVDTHLKMTSYNDFSEIWKPEMLDHYKPVAAVSIDDYIKDESIEVKLERVFSAANGHPSHHLDGYINFGRAHSLSVGDLIKTSDGVFWAVAPAGFDQIPK